MSQSYRQGARAGGFSKVEDEPGGRRAQKRIPGKMSASITKHGQMPAGWLKVSQHIVIMNFLSALKR